MITAAAAAGGGARITVRDHGSGIDPEHAGQIFEPYFTTRRTGTGLGLPITRNIVEGLGGAIAVRHEHPGTTVEITLPGGAGDGECTVHNEQCTMHNGITMTNDE